MYKEKWKNDESDFKNEQIPENQKKGVYIQEKLIEKLSSKAKSAKEKLAEIELAKKEKPEKLQEFLIKLSKKELAEIESAESGLVKIQKLETIIKLLSEPVSSKIIFCLFQANLDLRSKPYSTQEEIIEKVCDNNKEVDQSYITQEIFDMLIKDGWIEKYEYKDEKEKEYVSKYFEDDKRKDKEKNKYKITKNGMELMVILTSSDYKEL